MWELYPSYGLCELGRRCKSRKLLVCQRVFHFRIPYQPSLIVPQYEYLYYIRKKKHESNGCCWRTNTTPTVKQENTISIKIKTEVRKILRDHLTKNMVTKVMKKLIFILVLGVLLSCQSTDNRRLEKDARFGAI